MKVVFSMPTYSRHPCEEIKMSSLATQYLFLQHGIDTVFRDLGGDPYLPKARNTLASEFLLDHKDADYLFFVDDDVGWPAEAALRLVKHDADVCVGIYPKKNDDEEWPVELIFEKKADGSTAPIEQNGLYLTALAPTGFMCIRRNVLESCAEDSGRYPRDDAKKGVVWSWDIFRTGFVPDEPNGKVGRWWGEDFFFSIMVRNLGFQIWTDPDIDFTHRGTKAWKGNFNVALKKKIIELSQPKLAFSIAAE
jgi:hypothetical protein